MLPLQIVIAMKGFDDGEERCGGGCSGKKGSKLDKASVVDWRGTKLQSDFRTRDPCRIFTFFVRIAQPNKVSFLDTGFNFHRDQNDAEQLHAKPFCVPL